MRQVNIHEAKTHLSRLLEEAVAGKPFIIAKAGKPMVQVLPIGGVNDQQEQADAEPMAGKRFAAERFGFMKGKVSIPDDFDTAHQDEIVRMFEGEE
jgi:prevent-host-death family protein